MTILGATTQTKKFPLFWVMIGMYGFLVHFGNIYRINLVGVDWGPTTIVVFLVAIFYFEVALRELANNLMFRSLAFLMFFIFINGLIDLNSNDPSLAFPVSILMLIIFSAVISRKPLNQESFKIIVLFSTLGLLISSMAVIAAYFGYINIPGGGENVASTYVAGTYIKRTSGFFTNRTGMASIYSITITSSFLIFIFLENWKMKLFYFASSAIGALALLMTHNRSGLIGVTFAVFWGVIANRKFNSFGLQKMFLILFVSISVVFLVSNYFGEHLVAYSRQPDDFEAENVNFRDLAFRFDLFLTAVRHLASENILGFGYSLIPLEEGAWEGHNVFTTLLWSGGLITLITFFYVFKGYVRFVDKYKKVLLLTNDRYTHAYVIGVFWGLVAWMIGNLFHTQIGVGLAWVFFGCVFSLHRTFRAMRQEPSSA